MNESLVTHIFLNQIKDSLFPIFIFIFIFRVFQKFMF